LTGAVDAQIGVRRDAARNIIAEVEAAKDGPEGATFTSALEVVEVGTDDHGEAITSCIIVEVTTSGKPTKGKAPRLSDNSKLALDALKDAIAGGGEEPPASNHIPQVRDIRVCHADLWRRYFYARKGDERATGRQAFKRARDNLQALKIIGVWNDYVWCVTV
jgi:hypothetical protein